MASAQSLVILEPILGCPFSVVFLLTYVVNGFTGGVRYISFNEQLIMVKLKKLLTLGTSIFGIFCWCLLKRVNGICY